MTKAIDIILSGIHDAKNQLFIAEGILANAEDRHSIDLGEARYAIEMASTRLNRMVASYRAKRLPEIVSMAPVVVDDFCEEVSIEQMTHLRKSGLLLEVRSNTGAAWLFDRELVMDMVNNAVQNAGRYAKSKILLSSAIEDDYLVVRVEDDGPGYASMPPAQGAGLVLAKRLTRLHVRNGRRGKIRLSNGASLGGALMEIFLP